LHPPKESERKEMTKGLETLAKKEGIEKNQENPELAKIKGLFEQYEKEIRYLRNFSMHTLKGCWRVFNRWLKYVGEMATEKNPPQFVISICEAGLTTTTRNSPIARSIWRSASIRKCARKSSAFYTKDL
jgi:hypothetical protein